jgi:hypothetical protein
LPPSLEVGKNSDILDRNEDDIRRMSEALFIWNKVPLYSDHFIAQIGLTSVLIRTIKWLFIPRIKSHFIAQLSDKESLN